MTLKASSRLASMRDYSMRSFGALSCGALLGVLLVSVRSSAQPEPADAQVKRIVEDAINRGNTVILKKVDYVGGEGESPVPAPGGNSGAVRSKTYIEIDSRSPSAMDGEMVQSQKRVEESQQEMMKALDTIGQGQERQGVRLSGIESRGQDISAGMKRAADEEAAIRGQAADTGGATSDADRAVMDSDRLLMQINDQAASLSNSVSELSSRIEGARGGMGHAPGSGQTRAAIAGGPGQAEGSGGGGAVEGRRE